MYIYRWGYNTLSRWVTSIKMNLSGVMVAIGSMGVIGGMTIMWNDPAPNTLGGFIALLGLALCIGSYFRVVNEDNAKLRKEHDKQNLQQKMISAIKDMNKNMSELIAEIRRDRDEGTQPIIKEKQHDNEEA